MTSDIPWDTSGRAIPVAADRTLASALRRMAREHAEWIVVMRRVGRDEAFRRQEIERLAQQSPSPSGSWMNGKQPLQTRSTSL